LTREDIRTFAEIRQESENGHHGYDLGTDIREIGNSLSEFIGSVPPSLLLTCTKDVQDCRKTVRKTNNAPDSSYVRYRL